jgi:hypothetical protein
MIISFAYTAQAYLSGKKTVTRRKWKPAQIERWQRAWDEGRLVHDAWSNLPFVPGARRLGRFRLTCRPYVEQLGDMPQEDLKAEGGLWDSLEEFIALFGGDPALKVAVVRFERIVESIGTYW